MNIEKTEITKICKVVSFSSFKYFSLKFNGFLLDASMTIYESKDGKYFYTVPKIGSKKSVSMSKNNIYLY